MSWLKKVFNRLKDEPIQSDEASYKEERNIDAPNEKNKDIEARISYQYPKGEFRFPVIPDQGIARREERENRSEQRRQRRSPSQEKEKQSEKEAKIQKGSPKKEKASEKKGDPFKRPFRPTEIPSPIYGFSKPAQKDPIQFELKSHEPRLWRESEKAVEPTQPEIRISEDLRSEDYTDPSNENKDLNNIVKEEKVLLDEFEPLKIMGETKPERLHSDVPAEESSKLVSAEAEIPEELLEDHSVKGDSEVESVIETKAQQVLEDTKPVKTETGSDSFPFLHEKERALTETAGELVEANDVHVEESSDFQSDQVTVETPEEPSVKGDFEGDTVIETEEQHGFEETKSVETEEVPDSLPGLQDVEESLTETTEETNEVFEDVSLKSETMEAELFIDGAESAEGQEVTQDEPEQSPQPASKRSHLPFNVLMLKQDKRMMDRKKRLEEMRVQNTSEEESTLEQGDMEKRVNETVDVTLAVKEDETAIEESPLQSHNEEDQPEQDDLQYESPVAVEAEEYPEENPEESVLNEELESENDPEPVLSQGVEEINIEPAPAEEKISSQPEPSESPSKRSHLPFNVLMLKQDKRKMVHPPKAEPVSETKRAAAEEKIQDNTTLKKYEELAEEPIEEEGYEFPQLNFLAPPIVKETSGEWLEAQRELLNDTLVNFNVRARVVNVTEGPAVTRFEVQPEPGVKVNKITNLADDIKLSLAARDIRIEAPIPGKHTIGIEVPNQQSRPVSLSEIISSSPFQESSSPLTAALGLDISGEPIVTDLNKMPHGLIAGATGSGKSVCINSILVSLLYKASPQELKLLLIDPKMVELAPYNRMPHLVSPVITDVKAATAALKWAVEEMERRYELFAHTGVRDITRYNLKAERNGEKSQKLPYLVIVIDELADLMMMSPADVEEAICRIAQKARACGIHLIIATQRPSVDVITGLIKANVPTRIAFSVSSGVDSRTIIDASGAEKLLGKGDMLFLENGSSKPVRLQGTFVSDDEIDEIVHHVRGQGEPNYLFQQDELLKKAQVDEQEDELFLEACEFVVNQGGASTSLIQRHFRVGYNRAARLVDMMESHGIVSEAKGSKPRDVLISSRELEELQDTSTMI
ncbi:DNA translocase FtsK [Rossellomorea vietnamensis]|uniref:DNA translocase FtsK n=1 Tax=Rossellomorea vietnamensis TaxID=218284 RepID=UPI003CF2DB83